MYNLAFSFQCLINQNRGILLSCHVHTNVDKLWESGTNEVKCWCVVKSVIN